MNGRRQLNRWRLVTLLTALLVSLCLSSGLALAREQSLDAQPVSSDVSADSTTVTFLFARLTGSAVYPAVTGQAVYVEGREGRALVVTLQHARPLAGQTLVVVIDGKAVGRMIVNRYGQAILARSTKHGDDVPTVVSGAVVGVATLADQRVAAGRFRQVL